MQSHFEWDEAKAESNLAKHRVSFEAATAVFDDPRLVIVATIREADGEQRFKAIGRIGARVFTVVYAQRGKFIRIISARRANPPEEKLHAQVQP